MTRSLDPFDLLNGVQSWEFLGQISHVYAWRVMVPKLPSAWSNLTRFTFNGSASSLRTYGLVFKFYGSLCFRTARAEWEEFIRPERDHPRYCLWVFICSYT